MICLARDGCTSDTGMYIVQQMDAYMGFAYLKTVKKDEKMHCHGVLFSIFKSGTFYVETWGT